MLFYESFINTGVQSAKKSEFYDIIEKNLGHPGKYFKRWIQYYVVKKTCILTFEIFGY